MNEQSHHKQKKGSFQIIFYSLVAGLGFAHAIALLIMDQVYWASTALVLALAAGMLLRANYRALYNKDEEKEQ